MRLYDLILTDPPWRQSRGGKKSVRPESSGGEIPYDVMSLDQIEAIQREAMNLAKDDHVLFMWTIDKYLHEAEEMALGMGYKLHARMIWNKVTGIPAAFTIRFGHEYLLYMWRGKFPSVAEEQRGKFHSVFTEKVRNHSQKPEISYEIIGSLYPDAKKLEMYARPLNPMFPKRDGWDVWGNEVESDVAIKAAK